MPALREAATHQAVFALGVAAALPLSTARILVSGTDVTLICYGPTVKTCAEANPSAVGAGVNLALAAPGSSTGTGSYRRRKNPCG